MFQNLSQAVFCLGSQKREEIRHFRHVCNPVCSSTSLRYSVRSRDDIVIGSIGARLDLDMNIHDSDITRLSASALYDFCTFHTKVI